MKADTQQFWAELETADTMVLATSKDDVVTIRPVSPLRQDTEIVLCTSPSSRKAAQILANSDVAISLGSFYLQGKARSLGPAHSTKNQPLLAAYEARHPGAFSGQNPQFTGDEVFITISPTKLTHWVMNDHSSPQLAESFL